MMRIGLTAAVMAFLPAVAGASADSARPASLPLDGVGGVMLNLVLVLLLVVVCGWLYARGSGRLRGDGGALTVIASQAVGNRERLAIVQVGDTQLLLGITAQSINHLHTLDAAIDPAETAGPSVFGARLRELTARARREEAAS